jgi:hypothetical protein
MQEFVSHVKPETERPWEHTAGPSRPQGLSQGNEKNPLVPTIFHENWWLNAVTRGAFDQAEVSEGGRVVGRLPFGIRKYFGFKEIRMPCLTHFLGPAIDEGEGSPNNRFLKSREITHQLIQKLPCASSQYVKCHRGVTDVIAFQEHGFRTHVQFTHEIDPKPQDNLWLNLRNQTRNVIRKAGERHSLKQMLDPREFMWFYEQNLAKRGLRNKLDPKLCVEIIATSVERGRGRIIAACDHKGRIVAANFCVWDETSTFYLLSTRTEDSGNGAASFVLWEAIRESASRGLLFDFAGVSSKGSVLHFSGFGASITCRYVAVRDDFKARLLKEAKKLFRPESCFF